MRVLIRLTAPIILLEPCIDCCLGSLTCTIWLSLFDLRILGLVPVRQNELETGRAVS